MKTRYCLLVLFIFFGLSLVSNTSYAQASYILKDSDNNQVGPSSSIQFGSVEVSLATQLEFTLENNTTPPGSLNICSIQLERSGAVDFTEHWDLAVLDDVGNAIPNPSSTITSGFPLKIILTFSPGITASGSVPAKLVIKSNVTGSCGGTPDQREFTLQGVANRTIINYSLVLDRSGSMGNTDGNPYRRIDILADAVDFFLSLEKLRGPDSDTGFEGDKISLIKYDDIVNEDYFSLQVVTTPGGSIEDAKALVTPEATNDEALIEPRGMTATGDAVYAAIENVLKSNTDFATQKNVVVLFSDGYENDGSLFFGDTDLMSALAEVDVYSIGMGSANATLLQNYSLASNLPTTQYKGVDMTSFDNSPDSELSLFFLNAFKHSVGYSGSLDPIYFVNFSDSIPVVISQEAMVTSSDKKILFSIVHPRNLRDFISFEIQSPSGKTLSEGAIEGLATRKVDGRNHMVYEVTIEENADVLDYVGQWTLKGGGLNPSAKKLFMNNFAELDPNRIPVGFAVSVLSNLKFDIDAGVIDHKPGAELMIAAEFEDKSTIEPIEVVDFKVVVTRPDGEKITLMPQKDQFGTFIARYPHTQKAGLYEVYAMATVKNARGELATRDVSKHVVLSDEKTFNQSQEPCLSCNSIKVIIALSVILLLLILIVILRRPRP